MAKQKDMIREIKRGICSKCGCPVEGLGSLLAKVVDGKLIHIKCPVKEVAARQEEIREMVQHLWCQHCKALQKTNNTMVECWYNPLAQDAGFAFCAANEDAVDTLLEAEAGKDVVIMMERELLPLIGDKPIGSFPKWTDKEIARERARKAKYRESDPYC